MLLSVQDLSMSYPRARRFRAMLCHPFRHSIVQALCDVTFQIGTGEILTVVGPNGAGKSTLCRILTGLLIPDSGSIEFNGDTVRGPIQLRGRVGFCSNEERSFLPRVSGRENLRLFAALDGLAGGLANSRIDDLIDLLHLGEIAEQPFMYWSTGMRQRLNLARSLIINPAMLVLDEPTRSLDPLAARELRLFIKNSIASGRDAAVIWCTHILSEVAELNGTIAVLRQGKLVAIGDNEAITLRAMRGSGSALYAADAESSMVDEHRRQPRIDENGNLVAAIHSLLTAD